LQARKTAADYAAIAVAPILIFLMISSLANFLILVLYRGEFQSRLSWTVMCFTMGIVAVARIAIERDRVYSYGYAAALGLATLVVMFQLVDSFLFCIFILVVVGYLADLIVRDCTLIDDDVDASGEGLIDSGHLFLKKQMQESIGEQDDLKTDQSRRKTSQPGRTVMYLALAALPLFGLGQFFLRNDTASWASAKYLLAFYLFASLSLLVTTSFVGLRRYLRQRKVEMPADVTIAWLSAGLVLIAAVLMLAYFAPMPGRALATFELPKMFDSPGNTSASQFGWGDEGADQGSPDAPGTTSDPNADRKDVQGSVNKKGGEAGGSGDGNRKDGPAGTRKGGKKSAGSQEKKSQNSSDQNSGKQPGSKGDDQKEMKSKQQGKQQQSNSEAGKSKSSDSESGESKSSDSESSDSESGDSESGDSESGESESGEREKSEGKSAEQKSEQQSEDPSSEDRKSQSNASGSQQSSSDSQSSVGETISNTVSMLGSVLKFLIIIVLALIIGVFFYRNWSLICQWFSSLFASKSIDLPDVEEEQTRATLDSPPRPFSSFRNPIGRDPDLRRVMVITFQAFESWSWESGVIRGKEETPAEFTRRVAKTLPEKFSAQLPRHAAQVVESYNRIVFGRGNATKGDIAAAAHVWDVMNSHS
jgi:hypothetical protein